jgi:hypothetical protein
MLQLGRKNTVTKCGYSFVWMRKLVLALKKEHKPTILEAGMLNYVAGRSGRLRKKNPRNRIIFVRNRLK